MEVAAMPVETVGVFTINYTLFTSAPPGYDVQFGMDFTLTSTVRRPLSQLIFPAVAVGRNVPGRWNIDNHDPGDNPASLVFANAGNGTITDTPREICARNGGVKTTKFGVYLVDLQKGAVQSVGVRFGYSINTSDATPQTSFTGFIASTITNEKKVVMQMKCRYIKFL
jgi:hypothetical protein